MKPGKFNLTILIVALVASAVFSFRAFSARSSRSAGKVYVREFSSRTRGNRQAEVKVVEFTDFQCPACGRAVEAVADAFRKYPDKIYLEHKNFPLAMHPFARRAAIYAECATDQGRFWPFHDVLFRSQASWAKMTSVDAYFSQLAVSLGIDGVKLAACVNSEATAGKIDKDIEEGKKLGVNSTPSFFVNGKLVVGGKNFTEEINSILGSHGK